MCIIYDFLFKKVINYLEINKFYEEKKICRNKKESSLYDKRVSDTKKQSKVSSRSEIKIQMWR
jgi:hypothetical protein